MASADTAEKDNDDDDVVEKGREIELNKRKELQMDRFIQYSSDGMGTGTSQTKDIYIQNEALIVFCLRCWLVLFSLRSLASAVGLPRQRS
jgi:hypothetical protein